MSLRLMIAWFLFAGLHAAEPAKVVWATPDKPEWDGWVKDVAKMRAARKPQPAAATYIRRPSPGTAITT